jgi:hypothetical protein
MTLVLFEIQLPRASYLCAKVLLYGFFLKANQSFQAPPVGVIKRSSVTTTTSLRKPPLPPAGRSSTSVYSTVSAAAPRRSAASRYAADDDDVDFMPPTPVTKSVIRASSVPPRLPVVAPGSTRTTSYTVSQTGPYVTTSRQYLPSTTVNGPTATTWTIYSNGVNNDYNTIDVSSAITLSQCQRVSI